MKKVIAILLISTMMGALFTGCGTKKEANTDNEVNTNKKESVGEKKETVNIKFFTGKVETVDLMNEMIEEFNEKNPGIVVEQEFQKDASNLIKIKFASDDIPDITTVVSQEYIDQGQYLDLSNENWWERIQPSIKNLCTDVKSKKQYKVASNMTMAGLFYNKETFENLGLKEAKTWAEFEKNLIAIKESSSDIDPLFMGGKESWMLGHLIEFMAHGVVKQQLGVTDAKIAFLDNDDSKLNFGSENGPMDSFAKCILSLKENGLLNDDFLTATYDNQVENFANGKAAMISQGMWALGGILDKNPELATKIGFSPYPSIVEGTSPVILSAEDSAYAITSASEHPEEAKKFLDFLFEKENLKKYSEFIKSPCAFTDVEADWGPLKIEVAKALQNGVNIGFTNEAPAGFSGDDAGRMVQELYAGKYKTSMEFANAYKSIWDKAWNISHK